jgi:hypothetical protein
LRDIVASQGRSSAAELSCAAPPCISTVIYAFVFHHSQRVPQGRHDDRGLASGTDTPATGVDRLNIRSATARQGTHERGGAHRPQSATPISTPPGELCRCGYACASATVKRAAEIRRGVRA